MKPAWDNEPYPVSLPRCMSGVMAENGSFLPKDITDGARAAVPNGLRVERAAGDFRRGAPVLVTSERAGDNALFVAVETATDATLAALTSTFGAPVLLLTHARADTLKIRLYTPDVVAVPVAADARAAQLRAIADPTADMDNPMKGPFQASRDALPETASASVKLAKLSGLLPATLMFRASHKALDAFVHDSVSAVSAAIIAAYDSETANTLAIVTRAHVPLADAENTELIAFRPADGGPEHYAIRIGAPSDPVLVRLHSECFTGDLLGSLKCDCGDQLRGAIAAISAAGGGVLLYLAQEGRGIGLMNKLRAYRLQTEGFDTMEANTRLGFADDERMYDLAARMLKLLGIARVRLMTNNPLKVAALQTANIDVVERVPHSFPENAHNRDYLRTKAEKGGHLL